MKVLTLLRNQKDSQILQSAALLLGHAGGKNSADPLRDLMESPDRHVADAAAIGLALLGYVEGLERTRLVLERLSNEVVEEHSGPKYVAFRQLQTAAIVGLMTLGVNRNDPTFDREIKGTEEAVRYLGEFLLSDIASLTVQQDADGRPVLSNRHQRAKEIITVMKIFRSPFASDWLERANENLNTRPEILELFGTQQSR